MTNPINNGIDTKFRVKYEYAHTQHPEKHLDALIRFLIKQQRLQKDACAANTREVT